MTTVEQLSPTEDFFAWSHEGACRNHSIELFYNGEDERKGIRRQKERLAKQICADCRPFRFRSA